MHRAAKVAGAGRMKNKCETKKINEMMINELKIEEECMSYWKQKYEFDLHNYIVNCSYSLGYLGFTLAGDDDLITIALLS